MPKNKIHKLSDGRYTYSATDCTGKRHRLNSLQGEKKSSFIKRCDELDKQIERFKTSQDITLNDLFYKWVADTWADAEENLENKKDFKLADYDTTTVIYKNMITNNEISNFFFIRYYTQNSATLRLRFKYVSTKKEIVLEKINSLHEKLYLENIIKKSTYDSYEREVGRYGGLDSLELAENIFFIDSMNAFVLIDAIINLEKEKMME